MKITVLSPLPQTYTIHDGMYCGDCKYRGEDDCLLFGGKLFGKKRKLKCADCYNAMMTAKQHNTPKKGIGSDRGQNPKKTPDYMDFIHE